MEKIGLVLLAAGDSRRFQGNKLLHLLEGKPMYQYLTEQITSLPEELFFKKIIVTQYSLIMADMAAKGYVVVENQESHLGISHSIELALGAMGNDWEAVCFAVCDQPYLQAKTLETMIQNWKRSEKGIGCLSYQGEPGNPVVFSKSYCRELLELEGDVGGKRIVRRHPGDLYLFEVENEQELQDIDTK